MRTVVDVPKNGPRHTAEYMLQTFRRESTMTRRPILITAAALMLTAALADAQTAPKTTPKTTPKTQPKTPPKTAPGTTQKPAPKTTPKSGTAAKPRTPAATAARSRAALMDPSKLKAVAPPVYKAAFDTSAGSFVIEVHRDWAPKGADRFYNLVKNGFFDNCRFFRVVKGFMVQFGINGDPAIQKHWADANIPDDPVTQKNLRGYVTFAKTSAPNSRSTQVFINFTDRNTFLDSQGFAPFGQVTSGMDIVDKLYSEYGDTPSNQQPRIQAEGNKFLNTAYPKLDYVTKARIAS
jgi:peptidyl-prolyl cis-trans isomerase A (cyclophilin A)